MILDTEYNRLKQASEVRHKKEAEEAAKRVEAWEKRRAENRKS